MKRALALALLVVSCAPADKPARVAWNRDTCRGCGMALSERHFAVQVRGGPKSAVEKFDDLGCAVKWLAKQPWAGDPATKVWVASSRDGAWLDAKQARYVDGQKTPMGSGWGAVDGAGEGLDFTAVQARILGSAK
jgi:hypothetical protein